MKRSAQVALVLMGVTGTTAAGAYMMPARQACEPARASAPAGQAVPAPALNPDGTPAPQEQPCRRRSWGGWHWSSRSSNSSSSWRSTSSNRSGGWFSRRSSSPTYTSTAPSSSSPHSTSTGSHYGSTPRGGFGGTGHSYSSGG